MPLASLSTDSLGSILFYLDGVAFVRLLECGNVPLSAKIAQTRLDLKIVGRPLMKFPFSLFKLPQLASLSISAHKEAVYYPLKLDGALPIPTTPVKALTKLNLACIQCFSILRLENGVPLLDTVIPNLKSLRLTKSSLWLETSHMEAVPRGLEKLSLKSRHTRSSNLSIPCSLLYNLPPQLRKLQLTTRPLATDPERKDYSLIVWPVHLRILCLTLLSASILQHIPPHVEELKLSLTLVDDETEISHARTDIFPASITHLEVVSMHPLSLKFQPTTWPPSLKSCHIAFDYARSSEDDWLQVPKTIRNIHLGHDFPYVDKVALFFPNTATLSGISGMGAYPASLMSNLPLCLQDFYNTENSIEHMPHVPSSISEMMINIRPASATLQIASDTPSSSSSIPRPCDMSRLPPNLTDLYLLNAAVDHKFYSVDFECMPSNLKVLTVDLQNIGELEAFSALPKTLETLIIVVSEVSDEINSELVSDFELFDHLPSTLTKLTMPMDQLCAAWTEWIRRAHRFTALKTLDITIWDHDASKEPICLDFISTLPRTITDLQLPLFNSTIRPEQFAELPPYLTTLCLRSVPESSNTASDDCFASLPSSLVHLELPSSLQGLTTELFAILPPNIAWLSVPFEIEHRVSLYFERASDWGDFRPI